MQRAADLRDELEDLNLEIDFDEDEFGLSLAQIDTWIERELKSAVRLTQGLEKSYNEAIADGDEDMAKLIAGKMKIAKQEETVLYELAAAKAVKVEQDKEHALEDIRDEIEANFKTSIQNQIDAFDKKRDDWINAGMDEAEATELAERLKADAIETLNEEAVMKLGAIYQTSLEQRLAQIEKEKQAWIDKGVDEVKATQWAEQAKADAQRNAAMSVLKTQLKEYRVFLDFGYEGLMDYRREELFKSGITPWELRTMTPQKLAAFQKAQDTVERNLLPNFATAYDRAEDSRLSGNQFVDDQRKTPAAIEKFTEHDMLTGDDVRRLAKMSVISADAVLPPEQLDKMYQPINQTVEEFQTLVPQIESVKENLGEMNNAITEFSATEQEPLPERPPEPVSPVEAPKIEPISLTIDTNQIFSAFEELVSPLDEVNAQFAELTNQLIETTSSLSEFVNALNQLQQPQQVQNDNRQTNSPRPTVTNNVYIYEPHAWYSQHISELADKVADKITPELTRAIGGDSNGY